MSFTKGFCASIVGLAVFVFYKLVMYFLSFTDIKKKFEDGTVLTERIKETGNRTKIHLGEETNIENSTTYEKGVVYHFTELKRYKAKYLDTYAKYVSWSQMIALFPLLGIFGTVYGLVRSGGLTSIDVAMNGLSTAMETTLFGLIASIVLKAFDALGPGKMVNIVEALFSVADEASRMETIVKGVQNASKNESA